MSGTGECLDYYFNLDRVVETHKPHDIFVSRIGYADMLPGSIARFWVCSDQPTRSDGTPGAWELQSRMFWSLESLLFFRVLTGRWLAKQGVELASKSVLLTPPPRMLM